MARGKQSDTDFFQCPQEAPLTPFSRPTIVHHYCERLNGLKYIRMLGMGWIHQGTRESPCMTMV